MPLSLSEKCLSIAPSATLAIDARAKEMKAQGEDVIGFGTGEPDFDTPEYIRNAAKYALDTGMTRYTPVGGTAELRKEIVKKLERENGLVYDINDIVVSNGAKHSIYNALFAILNPGDEVLLPAPCWVSYPEMVKMVGGVPVMVTAAEEEGFIVTAQKLAQYVTPNTKALILNSPSNPTGVTYPEEVLREIAQLAVEKGFYIISDEIYEKLIYDGRSHVSIAQMSEEVKAQTIVINGISKAYAMTGWRIGYAAAPAPIAKAIRSFQSQATSNPNSIAQYAAAVALTNGEEEIRSMVKEFDERRKLMHHLVNEIPGLSARMPSGAFYLMMNISGVFGKTYHGQKINGSQDFARILLEDAKVAVVPGAPFGDDRFVRLSYATSRDRIRRGLDRIAGFVAQMED